MTTLLSNPTNIAVNAPAVISAGFGTGSDKGSFSGGVWTPGLDASGLVNGASWATVPTGQWVQVAGSNISALIPAVKAAVPDFMDIDSNWGQWYGGTWSGLMMDWWTGSRFWYFGGGHNAGINNGLYRFDVFKMKWAIECLPSGASVMADASLTQAYAPAIIAATQAKLGAGQLSPINDLWGEQYYDNKPACRHNYGWGVYCQGENRIMFGGRRFWSFNLATGQWDYRRVIGDDFANTTGVTAMDVMKWGIEDGCAFWDESTKTYYADQTGSNGFASGIAFAWPNKTWIPFSGQGQITPENAITRVGRKIVKFAQPFSPNSLNSYHWVGSYSVYDLDQGAVTLSGNVQMVGFDATRFFASGIGGGSFDGGAMCYIPPINRYWCWCKDDTSVTGQYATLYELDPTTTPWTMTIKLTTGNVPVPYQELMHKLQYMSAINAVVYSLYGDKMMYIYKF